MTGKHPGQILLRRHMLPFGVTQNALGRAIGVAPRRINEIVHGKRSITADTAVRLGRFFSNDPAYWMRLQTDYDIAEARRRIAGILDAMPPLRQDEVRPAPPPVAEQPAAAPVNRTIKRRMMR